MFEVLFRVHPALRRRLRTARSVFDDRRWGRVIERWRTVEYPAFRLRLDDAARVDVAALDDQELAEHVGRIASVFVDSTRTHFAHAPWGAMGVGDFLVRCEAAGISGPQAMRALAGCSDPVRRPTELADAIVDALRDEGGLAVLGGSDAAGLFDAIAAVGPRSRRALQAYVHEVGALIAGGDSLATPTVGEQPHRVQSVLRSRVNPVVVDVRAGADRVADELAERVPAADRAAWRESLNGARLIAPLRDDDVGVLSESVGRARLALLEVGCRLVDRNLAVAPSDAFELRPDEVGPTLAGRGVDAAQLGEWVTKRRQQAVLDPPATLGPPPQPPPIDRFPAPIARVTAAVWAFTSRFDAGGDDVTANGHGACPGEVTGRAVVIRDLDDLDRVAPGDIIVARTTMPTFNTVLAMSAGVVTQTGGAICHAAIMSRELGIPGVVGYPGALDIPDGATIHLDGAAGTVRVLADATPD